MDDMDRATGWFRQIPGRHSVRAFTGKQVPDSAAASISLLEQGFGPLCEGARAHLVRDRAADLFTGLLGPFGRISNVPAAVVFMADRNAPHHMEATGYLGEAIVLEAAALGLGTCWVAGSFDRGRLRARLESDGVSLTADGWTAVAITPLGYPAESQGMQGRLIKTFVRSRTRKPLSGLVTGLPEEQWPPNLAEVLEAARWAPSAVNRQPWRFEVDEEGVTLSADAPSLDFGSFKRLDCGIAMLHFDVAAQALGLEGHWEFGDGATVARFVFGAR